MKSSLPPAGVLFACLVTTAFADTPPPAVTTSLPTAAPTSGATPTPRYTFSWQLGQAGAPAPRGGSTQGPPIELDDRPSKAWQALQANGLSDFERDRRAILAMAGDYKVTFDFLEIEDFKADAVRDKPYQSWGTERIYVDIDSGPYISLVHILDMRIVGDDGKLSEPIVTKHWRQSWQYQPRELVEYQGHDHWVQRRLTRSDGRGQWAQTVYQVDESPRYASIGRWVHTPSFSSWISADTWRPLPRREWTVRKDYQVLLGTNRHTITATGWLQEENNLKMVLGGNGRADDRLPYLAREYGVARYARMSGGDFEAADEYYQRTRGFWDQVLTDWHGIFQAHPSVQLSAQVDQAGLFAPLFDYADELAGNRAPPETAETVIRRSLLAMGAPFPP